MMHQLKRCGFRTLALFRLVLGGIVIGLIATFALAKLISTQLYGVSVHDPLRINIGPS
jgi:hypothetical protein